MPDSKRELVLLALLTAVQTIAGPVVRRGGPELTEVGREGLVILRDGEPGEPEEWLSPRQYYYDHEAELVVLVQDADEGRRNATFDEICRQIGLVIDADRGLGGLVDYADPGAPAAFEEGERGSPAIKAAVVPVILSYATDTPLT